MYETMPKKHCYLLYFAITNKAPIFGLDLQSVSITNHLVSQNSIKMWV